jgi:hypothetical protein
VRSVRWFAISVGVAVLLLGATAVTTADDHHHEQPDEVQGDGDLESIERWLSGKMGERHVDCADGLAVGNFDACDDLDEEYESLLERYVSVERDLEGETSTSEQLNETRQQQREYAQLRKEFNRTYEEYREARADGDEARARELARELQRLGSRIEELGGELDVRFRELDGEVNANLTSASASINESTDQVRRVVIRVEQESFEPTRITTFAGPRSSFVSPSTVSGIVTTENETRVSGGRVVVNDSEQRFVTPVDDNGTYELAYRPVLVSTGETELTVQFRPADDQPYLGSNTTATTSVERTASTVEISDANGTVVIGDQLNVSGAVRASDRGVPAVPVIVEANGVVLAATRTNESGAFQAGTRIPAEVPAGDAALGVAASEAGRAIEPSGDAVPLTIAETPTDLRVTATRRDDSVYVSGRLTADNGATVGERPVTVTVGDTETEVTTDPDGTYRFEYFGDDAAPVETVTAEYDEDASNLVSSAARTRLDSGGSLAALATGGKELLQSIWRSILPGSGDSPFGGGRSLLGVLEAVARAHPFLAGIIGIGIVLNGVVWGAIAKRRWLGSKAEPTDTESDEAADAVPDAEPSEPVPDLLLDSARQHLETDPESAVRTGYAAVRSGLDGDRGSETHWEFYRAIGPELPDDRRPSLRSITETFERAAFAASGVERADAEAAIDDAEQCLEASDLAS